MEITLFERCSASTSLMTVGFPVLLPSLWGKLEVPALPSATRRPVHEPLRSAPRVGLYAVKAAKTQTASPRRTLRTLFNDRVRARLRTIEARNRQSVPGLFCCRTQSNHTGGRLCDTYIRITRFRTSLGVPVTRRKARNSTGKPLLRGTDDLQPLRLALPRNRHRHSYQLCTTKKRTCFVHHGPP